MSDIEKRPILIAGGDDLTEEERVKLLAICMRFAEQSGFCIDEVIRAFNSLNPFVKKAGPILASLNEVMMVKEGLDKITHGNSFIEKKMNKHKQKWQR